MNCRILNIIICSSAAVNGSGGETDTNTNHPAQDWTTIVDVLQEEDVDEDDEDEEENN